MTRSTADDSAAHHLSFWAVISTPRSDQLGAEVKPKIMPNFLSLILVLNPVQQPLATKPRAFTKTFINLS